jgi:hypothetical protein
MSAKDFLAVEYDKIKSEQSQRIGFRDNLIFVHLAATGAIASWVLTNSSTPNAIHALLVIPWVCIILGWTYVVNDNHISRTGRYVRTVMNQRACALAQLEPVEVVEGDGRKFILSETFGWESYHRIDKRRVSRKILQCVVDEIIFFLPGVLALLGYGYLSSYSMCGYLLSSVLFTEFICLLVLGAAIIAYADFGRQI